MMNPRQVGLVVADNWNCERINLVGETAVDDVTPLVFSVVGKMTHPVVI
jgi:hypothetical protein